MWGHYRWHSWCNLHGIDIITVHCFALPLIGPWRREGTSAAGHLAYLKDITWGSRQVPHLKHWGRLVPVIKFRGFSSPPICLPSDHQNPFLVNVPYILFTSVCVFRLFPPDLIHTNSSSLTFPHLFRCGLCHSLLPESMLWCCHSVIISLYKAK